MAELRHRASFEMISSLVRVALEKQTLHDQEDSEDYLETRSEIITMPTRQHRQHRRDSNNHTKKISTKSVHTQTDENYFCFCFVPEYTAQVNDEIILDPTIKVMLDKINSVIKEDGKATCVVRNFEHKPKFTAKQRWKISGNAVRAVGKLKNRKKKKLMNLTMTNYEDEEVKSGFYARNLEYEYEETDRDSYTKQRKQRWSLKRFSLKKKKNPAQRSMSDYQGHYDSDRIIEASKGSGKVLDEKDQLKSKENVIIENFINECLRENVRNNKMKNSESTYREDTTEDGSTEYHDKETTYNSDYNKERRTTVTRSVTLHQSSHISEFKGDGRKSLPKEHQRRKSTDGQHNGDRMIRRPKSEYLAGREIVEATERQKRASERYLNYIDSDKHVSSRFSKLDSSEKNSDHGSTLSAFALVPGTELQRKLSQRGINDKASIDIIKQTSSSHRKYPPPSSSSTKNSKYSKNRRSFHSVDNIYASSSSTKPINNQQATHMSQNLHNSYSADDIDDPENLFKPLEDPKNNEVAPLPSSMFVVTSTPREVEDVPEEQEEGYATYV